MQLKVREIKECEICNGKLIFFIELKLVCYDFMQKFILWIKTH